MFFVLVEFADLSGFLSLIVFIDFVCCLDDDWFWDAIFYEMIVISFQSHHHLG